MANSNPHHPFVLTVLQHVTTDRLQRAVNALADGSMTVTLTRQTEAEIRALVKNGAEREYGVVLTPTLTTCSCKDALYRGVVCKHTVATALHVLRTPQAKREPQPEPVRTVVPQRGARSTCCSTGTVRSVGYRTPRAAGAGHTGRRPIGPRPVWSVQPCDSGLSWRPRRN